ncbi:lipid droplet-associated hydrolase [Contarinia nasturtii]|uniref:lipid droplet-associated hydrolase n=1 Tax=Contarinia nasturtii TaxID=265458 RepID=UPI0012D3E8A3|nr:lipid droplet-associated hydrolase [Contarinia nasturtii]
MEKFVDVCGVPTKVITWGKSLGETFDKKEMILFIPGNPGICGFYVTFLTTLFKLLQGNVPIWAIGHLGHDEPENTELIPRLRNNKHLYDLNGQVDHKVQFIRNNIPPDVKITLIGHSVGTYISLELLKIDDIGKRIQHGYFLFPAFEYMADTPNGKFYAATIQKYFRFFYYLVVFLTFLPSFLVRFFIAIFYWTRPVYCDSELITNTLTVIRPSVLSKIVHLANDEMEKVKEPDYALIKENKNRLMFYYSLTDNWTPVTYYERLIGSIEGLEAQISDKHDHAFVLKSSHDMAALVAEWIQKNTV